MYNRQPTPGKEGRMRITPEDGSAPFYAKLQMADNPLHEGTPLIKATLLDDVTAGLFGFSEQAVPNDVLAFLGKYNQHWWKRTGLIPATYSLGESTTVSWAGRNGEVLIRYSDAVSVSYEGTVSLAEYTQISSTDVSGTTKNLNAIKGKFFQIGGGGTGINVATAPVYLRGSEDAAYSQGNSSLGLGAGIWTTVQGVNGIAAIENGTDFVLSSDRNAYPDNGGDEDTKYFYIGTPYENAATAPRVEAVSYVGTGTATSASKPMTLTFNIAPKLVILLGYEFDTKADGVVTSTNYSASVIIVPTGIMAQGIWLTGAAFSNNPNYVGRSKITDKTYSWYSLESGTQNVAYSANSEGYRYKAIGVTWG